MPHGCGTPVASTSASASVLALSPPGGASDGTVDGDANFGGAPL
jgi:hypothetical protein